MVIGIDRKKYIKKMLGLWFLALSGSVAFVLITSMNFMDDSFNGKRIIVSCFLFLISFLFCRLVIHFQRLWKRRDGVVLFENGELTDYTKLLNAPKGLRIENIASISVWTEYRGITQYKVITKGHDPKNGVFMNQLKGNHFYLSDYIVDSTKLVELYKTIKEQCKSNEH